LKQKLLRTGRISEHTFRINVHALISLLTDEERVRLMRALAANEDLPPTILSGAIPDDLELDSDPMVDPPRARPRRRPA
jgi:hypothetical protein